MFSEHSRYDISVVNFSLWKVPNLVVQICLERSDDGSLKGPLWVSFVPVGEGLII